VRLSTLLDRRTAQILDVDCDYSVPHVRTMQHILMTRSVFGSHMRTSAADHRHSKRPLADVHYTRLPYILSRVFATAVVLV
jgi:hypothetical protein